MCVICGSLGQKSSVFQPLQLARVSLCSVWQAEQSLLPLGNAPAMDRKPGQPQKLRRESRASRFPAQRDFNKKHIRCELSPLLFQPLRAKSCSRHSIHKRQRGSRKGCVGTDVNPRHVCSKRNTRNKAYRIKRLPDRSPWQQKILF